MRAFEFLTEFAPPTGQGKNDIELLTNIVNNVDPADPTYQQAMSVIKDLVNSELKNKPTTNKPVVQQPTQNDSATESLVTEQPSDNNEQWVVTFLKLTKNPESKARMESRLKTDPEFKADMRELYKGHEAETKKSYSKGGTDALSTVSAFFTDVKKRADLLAGKSVGVLDQLKVWYDTSGDRTDDPMSDRPKPTQKALYQKLLYPLENIFQDLGFKDQPPNLRNFKKEAPRILKFMDVCQDGIINFEDLINIRKGNVGNLITDPDLKYIYDKIYSKLLALDAGQGGGAWGPGELGLAILCRPMSKAKSKGDLITTYQGETVGVEVKASRDATAGARIGGKGVLQGVAGKETFTKALTALCKAAKFPISEFGTTTVQIPKYKVINGVKTRVASDKSKPGKKIAYTNLASSTWFETFNRDIPPRLAKQNLLANQLVGDFLVNSVSAVISTAGKPFFNEKLIRSIPAKDGSINYERFLQIITRQWYDIYKNVDEVGLILVINPISGGFTLVDSAASLINKDSGVVITGGLDFNDTQGKASPQIGTN
jgi:hypothetical protein